MTPNCSSFGYLVKRPSAELAPGASGAARTTCSMSPPTRSRERKACWPSLRPRRGEDRRGSGRSRRCRPQYSDRARVAAFKDGCPGTCRRDIHQCTRAGAAAVNASTFGSIPAPSRHSLRRSSAIGRLQGASMRATFFQGRQSSQARRRMRRSCRCTPCTGLRSGMSSRRRAWQRPR